MRTQVAKKCLVPGSCMLLSCSGCNKASHMCLLALVTGICRSWQPWQDNQHFFSSGTNSPSSLSSFKAQPSRFALVSSLPELPIGHAWRMRSTGLSYNTEESKPLGTAHLLKVNSHHQSLFPPGRASSASWCQGWR